MIVSAGKRFAAIIAVVLLISAVPLWADGQGVAKTLSGRLEGFLGAFGDPRLLTDPLPTGNQQAKSDYEIIYGNGTATEYLLAHTKLVPNSDYAVVGGISQIRDVDYHIDYERGMIMFNRPIRTSEYFVVGYSYTKGGTGERKLLNIPGLALTGNGKLSVDLTYGSRAVQRVGNSVTPNIATYGLNTTAKIGSNSTIKSMFYTSNPQRPDTSGLGVLSLLPTTPIAPAVKSDRIIVQNADLAFGKFKLQLGYQDVGPNFSGFLELRDSDAAPDAMLRRFEYEKGMKRTNIAMQFAPGGTANPALPVSDFFWNTIQDTSGEFRAKGFNFNTKNLGLFAETRGSDPTFAKLAYLAYGTEWSDTALQIRRQFDPNAAAGNVAYMDIYQTIYAPGIERSRYGLKFGSGPSTGWLQAVNISDHYGEIERYGFKVAGEKYSLSGFKQSVDKTFTKLPYLIDVEKEQFGIYPGTERLDIGGSYKLKNGLDAIAAMESFSDQYGSVATQSFGVKGKTWDVKANFKDVTRIDTVVPPVPQLIPTGSLAYEEGNTITLEAGMERGLFKSFAGLTNGKLKARVSTEQSSGRNKSATFEAGILRGTMGIDYADLQSSYGTQVESKGLRFISDRTANKWLYYDALYKIRRDGVAGPVIVRAYNATAKINDRTNLSYNYSTNTEYYDAKIVSPVALETLQLTSSLKNGYSLMGYFKRYEYLSYRYGVNSYSLALSGKLKSGASVAAGLGQNVALSTLGDVDGKTLWLRYDHQVSQENYLKFSVLATRWDGVNPITQSENDLEFRIDFASRFDLLSR
ncbi:MAG: hypothetical protein Q7N50_11395 [Armatimonadota bacterium]|nr:hypothetical protein [Armatimonadota bacterium]